MSVLSRFPERLREGIAQRLGWSSLRPIQELAAEEILDGRNVVVLAPTAGGKTEAALFPVLAGLLEKEPEGVGAIYVAPLRALLNNQEDRFGLYTEMVGLDRFVWHGDRGASLRKGFLKEPTAVLMTTPESIESMLLSPRVSTAQLFSDLRAVIVDEVHSFAGTDRGAHLMSVLARISIHSRHDIQRAGLSATVGNPEVILDWLAGPSARERRVVKAPSTDAPRELLALLREAPGDLAREAARRGRGKKSFVFCASRALTEGLAGRMRDLGTEVFVHHGSVSREERGLAEDRFRDGGAACIVATSTLELGIDVGDLDLVMQVDAPSTVSSFLQRMGRTGRRAGQRSNTTFLCRDPESILLASALVELAREGWVESIPRQDRCWPVLVHQLLAMALQHGGMKRDDARRILRTVPDFSGITEAEYGEVEGHLVSQGYLETSGALLLFGQRAEEEFGRKNFLELYAVFSTPALYRVETRAGQELGTLEHSFVERLEAEQSCFLLTGRAWVVSLVSHRERLVIVEAAPRGKTPTWGGFLPQLLGFEICQKARQLLVGSGQLPYLEPDAQREIDRLRDERGPALADSLLPVIVEPNAVRILTFVGGRINQTLKAVLKLLGQEKVIADNFQVRIEGTEATSLAVTKAFESISREGFFQSEETGTALLAGLPPFRLSKFQPLLPPRFAREVVGKYLLDFEGTARFVSSALDCGEGLTARSRPLK